MRTIVGNRAYGEAHSNTAEDRLFSVRDRKTALKGKSAAVSGAFSLFPGAAIVGRTGSFFFIGP